MTITLSTRYQLSTLRLAAWFTAAAAMYLSRGLIFSAWLSQGPQVQSALQFSTAQFGWLVMLWPLGGLFGISFSQRLVARLGSRQLGMLGFGLASACLAGLGVAVPAGQVLLTALLLFLTGLPIGVMDYLGSLEATRVDQASTRTLLPAINSAYGVGMLAATQLSGMLLSSGHGLNTNFFLVAIVAGTLAIVASLGFAPRRAPELLAQHPVGDAALPGRIWQDPFARRVVLIGFFFIVAEISAGVWVPVALTQSGSSEAAAAGALGVLWALVTLGRVFGGFIVDRWGRRVTMVGSALLTAVGVAVFMVDAWLHLSYLGLVLWGGGLALGFPLALACMGDDPAKAPARINLVIATVYLGGMVAGPLLGTLGQAAGLRMAFAIPLCCMMVTAALCIRLPAPPSAAR